MRRIVAILSRSPTTASYGVVAVVSVVVALWIQFASFFLMVDPRHALDYDVPFQLGLLSTLGVTCFAWVSLHDVGFVGAGTGAGFRLAALGFAARISVTLYVMMTGGEAGRPIYDELPSIAGPVWWVRNGSLVAFGCGIALVVIASAVDLVRRRRVPRWATIVD